MVDEIKEQFRALREKAERRLREEPEAQQLIALQSAKGEIYVFSSRDWTDPAPEEALLRTLRDSGDTEIELLVCLWQDGFCLDLPSMRFRRALTALDERNADTLILMNGEGADGRPCLNTIRLGKTMG